MCPCPACGGTDRYRWDEDAGAGGWFCNQCGGKDQRGGAGSGIDLLMRRQGWSFVEAARQVEAFLGLVPDHQGTSAGRATSRNGKPWRMPATTAAQAPVPQASVSPAPRSNTRKRISWRLTVKEFSI